LDMNRRPGFDKSYVLTGGEPTLHPQLDKFFKVFRNTGSTAYIITNGTMAEARRVVVANKDVVAGIFVSLDCADPATNDLTRGAGSYERAAAGIREYKQARIPVSLAFSLHDRNSMHAEKAFSFAYSMKVFSMMFIPVEPTRKGMVEGLVATKNRMRRTIAKIRRLRKKYPKVQVDFNEGGLYEETGPSWPVRFCPMLKGDAYDFLTLLPDGTVVLCCDLYDMDFYDAPFTKHLNTLIPASLGTYGRDTLDTLLRNKELRIAELRTRRRQDAEAGRLKDGREYTCTNCKFYHAHDNPDPGIAHRTRAAKRRCQRRLTAVG
jgi:MoaA/NifB/PqqE/SkfB family radical SAM enzyme